MVNTKRMEEISYSYLNALCAFKGIAVEVQRHDDDSIDVILKKDIIRKDGNKYSAQLGIQLKSTALKLKETDSIVHYPLKSKNYNDLVQMSTMQRLLFLLILPPKETTWICQDIEQLIIRKCMYWFSFSGMKNTTNQANVTLHIPKDQIVTIDSLLCFMEKVAEEDII